MGAFCKYNDDKSRQSKPLISGKCCKSRDTGACEEEACKVLEPPCALSFKGRAPHAVLPSPYLGFASHLPSRGPKLHQGTELAPDGLASWPEGLGCVCLCVSVQVCGNRCVWVVCSHVHVVGVSTFHGAPTSIPLGSEPGARMRWRFLTASTHLSVFTDPHLSHEASPIPRLLDPQTGNQLPMLLLPRVAR